MVASVARRSAAGARGGSAANKQCVVNRAKRRRDDAILVSATGNQGLGECGCLPRSRTRGWNATLGARSRFERNGGIMRTVLRTAALLLLASGVASQAYAGDKVWSVTGVVNDGLATLFTCTNGTSAMATVKVEIFNSAGASDSSGMPNVAPNATVTLGTKFVNALPGAVVPLGTSTPLHSGSARITAPSGVFCTAWVVDPVGNPPASMKTLPVFKKTNQKGD